MAVRMLQSNAQVVVWLNAPAKVLHFFELARSQLARASTIQGQGQACPPAALKALTPSYVARTAQT